MTGKSASISRSYNCIGNHFTLIEGRLLLATLAQRVKFELVPGQQVEPDPKITIRPRSGIKMVVYRRKGRGL